MVLNGIPPYRLPREVIAADVADILSLGVELRLNTRFGEDLSIEDLEQEGYAAIYLAIGAQCGSTGGIAGADETEGVYSAVDFLRESNAGTWTKPLGGPLVVGGGFTAVDAARSALRLGADEGDHGLPAHSGGDAGHRRRGERGRGGGRRAAAPHLAGLGRRRDGGVAGVVCQKMVLGEPDKSGRRRPQPIPGSEFTIPADTVILAIGQEVEGDDVADVCELTP